MNGPAVFAQNHVTLITNYFKNQAKGAAASQAVEVAIQTNTQIGHATSVYYVSQLLAGVPIDQAQATVAIQNNQILQATHNFDLNANTIQPIRSQLNKSNDIKSALLVALQAKGYEQTEIESIQQIAANQYQAWLPKPYTHPIFIDLVYTKNKSGVYELAYNIELYSANQKQLFLVQISLADFTLTKNILLTLSCTVAHHNHEAKPSQLNSKWPSFNLPNLSLASYWVYNFNLSGPVHGQRTLETAPHDLLGSPYGWHDIDGKPGADFTITRGNNVYAYEDVNSQNKPGYSPNGGPNLQFIYPFSGPSSQPYAHIDASITNLFYVNNKLHDVFYRFGFDENSGNFQANQYGRLHFNFLADADPLLAESQDGSGQNNANISVPRDGSSPRMQMYLWQSRAAEAIYVTAPESIRNHYASANNSFNPGHVSLPIYPARIAGSLILVQDDEATNLGCGSIANAAALKGNIALIKRGLCNFTEKVYNAQQAGAVAVLVMNNVADDVLLSMAGQDGRITIPALFVSKKTGDDWIAALQKNENVQLQISLTKQRDFYDASFDNSIIIHEFAHGVSSRLTGGRANSSCLLSTEQMGEGWSDFFALLFQIKDGDTGAMPKGIGSFVSGGTRLEDGIRTYPYSTDKGINPLTYDVTNRSFNIEEGAIRVNAHQVGTVWASILWDLTWKLIETHGFDANLTDPTSGNFIAFNLVMSALKLQPCNPSFITGRNALLKADELLYNGANSCLIWEAFANRGVGLHASAGFNTDPEDISDQQEDFTKPESCTSVYNTVPDNPTITVFPNPVFTDLTITIPNYTAGIVVELFDTSGRLILYEDWANFSVKAKIKLQEISKGIYILKIKGDKIKYQTKIIKN